MRLTARWETSPLPAPNGTGAFLTVRFRSVCRLGCENERQRTYSNLRPTPGGQGIAGSHSVCTRAEPEVRAVSGDPGTARDFLSEWCGRRAAGCIHGWSLAPVSHPWAQTCQSIEEHDAPSTVNASLAPDHGEQAARRKGRAPACPLTPARR